MVLYRLEEDFLLIYFAENSNKSPKINIIIGEINSKRFVSLWDLSLSLCKLTPKKELAKITKPIPKLIEKEARITAKYVFSTKA